MITSDADRLRLLRIARDAIAAHVAGAPRPSVSAAETDALSRRGAAFVTIHRNGELRGCIGHLETDRPLLEVIGECAVAACSADPRFSPVTGQELVALDIEISLLGPLEPISSPADVEVGRHGLVAENGWQRGLLLPQVAVEWSWDREMSAAQTCRKAGLRPDAWKTGAKLWRFEAEVFGEKQGGSGA